jgi:hypothetical protein
MSCYSCAVDALLFKMLYNRLCKRVFAVLLDPKEDLIIFSGL